MKALHLGVGQRPLRHRIRFLLSGLHARLSRGRSSAPGGAGGRLRGVPRRGVADGQLHFQGPPRRHGHVALEVGAAQTHGLRPRGDELHAPRAFHDLRTAHCVQRQAGVLLLEHRGQSLPQAPARGCSRPRRAHARLQAARRQRRGLRGAWLLRRRQISQRLFDRLQPSRVHQPQHPQFKVQTGLQRVLQLSVNLDRQLQPPRQVFFAELRRALAQARLLGFAGRDQPRRFAIGARDFGDRQVTEIAREFTAEMLKILARPLEFGDDLEHLRRRRRFQRVRHPRQRLDGIHAQQIAHRLAGQLGAAAGDGLVERRERVAHAALARLRQHGQRFRLGLDALLAADVVHARHDVAEFHRPEVELLAARGDGRRNLVRLRRAQNEHHPLGRLLQSFQQRVEGLAGDLVGFVDDENLVAVARRLVAHVFPQLAHIVDAAVGGRVDFNDVRRVALRNLEARGTLAARRRRRSFHAVQTACHDARNRGLAGSALAGEDVAVRDTLARDGVLERRADVFLTDQLVEALRPVLAGDDLVHAGGEKTCQTPGDPRHTG